MVRILDLPIGGVLFHTAINLDRLGNRARTRHYWIHCLQVDTQTLRGSF